VCGGEDDDFKNFDPRAFWAHTNNEEIEFTIQDNIARQKLDAILAEITAMPLTAADLAARLNTSIGSILENIKTLRKKGCEIEGFRTTRAVATTYRLISRPKVIHFPRGTKKQFRRD
jgi:biotin operon repressor